MADGSQPSGAPKRARIHGLLALTTCSVVWGSTFVLTKAVVEDIGAFSLTALRFLVALAALWPLARRQGFRWSMVVQRTFLLYGLTGIALYFCLQNAGLLFTSAGTASMIQAAIPAGTALLSYWFLKERLPLLRVAGIALSIVGVALIAGVQPAGAGEWTLLGNLLIVGSVTSFAVYAVQGKLLSASVPPVVMTTGSIAAGLLYILPLAVTEVAVTGLPRMSLLGWAVVLYLGLVASALVLFLWNFALGVVDASLAAVYLNLVPVVGLGFAAAFGETVAAVQLAGGALAMAGVWLSELTGASPPAQQRRPAEAAPR